MVHVPYRGTGPAIIGLLERRSERHVHADDQRRAARQDRARARARRDQQRPASPALPELPTVAESGLKGYESSQWYGVLAPAGTPEDILNALNAQIVKIMQQPRHEAAAGRRRRACRSAARASSSRPTSNEIAKWAKVIKQSGARID